MDATLETIKQFSNDQYSTEHRLNARIQIYDYCENKNSWHEWVFDNLDFSNVTRVLELGCGNGILWKDNTHRVPEMYTLSYQIILEAWSTLHEKH